MISSDVISLGLSKGVQPYPQTTTFDMLCELGLSSSLFKKVAEVKIIHCKLSNDVYPEALQKYEGCPSKIFSDSDNMCNVCILGDDHLKFSTT